MKDHGKYTNLVDILSDRFDDLIKFFDSGRHKMYAQVIIDDRMKDSFNYYVSDDRYTYTFKIGQHDYREFIKIKVYTNKILNFFSNKSKSKIKMQSYKYGELFVANFKYEETNTLLNQRFQEIYPNKDLSHNDLFVSFSEGNVKINDVEIIDNVCVVLHQILIDLI